MPPTSADHTARNGAATARPYPPTPPLRPRSPIWDVSVALALCGARSNHPPSSLRADDPIIWQHPFIVNLGRLSGTASDRLYSEGESLLPITHDPVLNAA
ncbi:hypothetical protein B0H13DRAFT_2660868 [Mycena leptocephala]|nr:hypothetical protein B0H13DRAFT_2660868 [Mycena leptocephala]